jgi:hypothetical protein
VMHVTTIAKDTFIIFMPLNAPVPRDRLLGITLVSLCNLLLIEVFGCPAVTTL